MMIHLKRNTLPDFPRDMEGCTEVFAREKDLKHHQRRIDHGGGQRFACTVITGLRQGLS
jgi:hypothetical protein